MKNKISILIITIILVLVVSTDINTTTVFATNSETMRAYYIVDDTGYFIEMVLLIKQDGVDYGNYIETMPNLNLKKPRWDGTQWVEGYVEPTRITPTGISKDITEKTVVDEEPLSLTATSLMLTPDTSYDINIDNQPECSTTIWTSTNTSIATVNNKGKVTAKKNGKTTITCTVTHGNDIQTLKAKVIVDSDNDNLPTLTENQLDLEVGELFDVDIENKISGCKYKWTISDKNIAKITTTSGKILALKSGTCVAICTIKTKSKKVYVLKCDVNIER